jgi:hypothetical protein
MFKTVIPRAGRFTTQWVRLDFDTRPALGAKATITLPTKGHLISRLFLVTTMPDIQTAQVVAAASATAAGTQFLGPQFTWTNSLGHALVNQATLEIGGARVEVLDGRLLEVLDEFYTPLERLPIADKLLVRNSMNFPQFVAGAAAPTQAITPLPFWFSRGDPGVFLPIDAIATDAVRVSITFAALNSLYVSSARRAVDPNLPPAAAAAYFPLAGSPFYKADAAGDPVYGLTGDPGVATLASRIPGIAVPAKPSLGDTYILAEYIYLDAPEANRFRIANIEVPIVQHYTFEPFDTNGAPKVQIPLRIPNPTRNIFFFAQRYDAPNYNAPFLATRDLSGADAPQPPWWPNAAPINLRAPDLLRPAFVFRDSEPLKTAMLTYEGSLVRYATLSPSLFRSIVPSYELKKAPFVNRYYYTMQFGLNHGAIPASQPSGEGNLDKVTRMTLDLEFKPFRGCVAATQVPRYTVYVWAETYNVFRVYGGRGGLLFAF